MILWEEEDRTAIAILVRFIRASEGRTCDATCSFNESDPLEVLRRAILLRGYDHWAAAASPDERIRKEFAEQVHAITRLIARFAAEKDEEKRIVRLRDGQGRTLLHCACMVKPHKMIENAPHADVVRAVLDAAGPRQVDRAELAAAVDLQGRTALLTLTESVDTFPEDEYPLQEETAVEEARAAHQSHLLITIDMLTQLVSDSAHAGFGSRCPSETMSCQVPRSLPDASLNLGISGGDAVPFARRPQMHGAGLGQVSRHSTTDFQLLRNRRGAVGRLLRYRRS